MTDCGNVEEGRATLEGTANLRHGWGLDLSFNASSKYKMGIDVICVLELVPEITRMEFRILF